MGIKTRVPGETYKQYKERPGRSSLTWMEERQWKKEETQYRNPKELLRGKAYGD